MRACPDPFIARAVRCRLLGQGLGPRKAHNAAATERVGRPRKLLGGEDRREHGDARFGPRDPHTRPTIDVLVEIAPVHSEEGHHLVQAVFERRIQTAGVDMDEPGKQIREQGLEPNAVLQKARVVAASGHARTLRF